MVTELAVVDVAVTNGCPMKKKRSSRNKSLKSPPKPTSGTLGALLGAALAIPGFAATKPAVAQSTVEPEVRVSYDLYKDYQPNGVDRMKVSSPSLWLKAPVSDKTTVEGSFVLDAVSGASPYYLSSVSSASIRDNRKAADVAVEHSFERFSINVGGAFSTEDDYDSLSGKVETKCWSEDKNTTYSLGVSVSDDSIGSTIDPLLDESRTSESYLIGVTQVINPRSIVQMNLTYGSGDGYFTDPYKTYDNRPRSREQWAWLTRYVLYLPELEGALHTDYRYYQDTFGVSSHMVEISIYQPLLSSWIVRPSIRYYSQSRADFFTDQYPPPEDGGFYSADQRLGDFGGVTLGLKVIKDFGNGFSGQISFDYIEQRPEWRIGGANKAEGIEPFYAQMLSIGVVKKF